MSNELKRLIDHLKVDRDSDTLFIGQSPEQGARIYGGQILAQALDAATQTVDDDRSAHSLHGQFLRPGAPEKAIHFRVEPIRDGNSFTTRRVTVQQSGQDIFVAMISFHRPETGPEHQLPFSIPPSPERFGREINVQEVSAAELQGEVNSPQFKPPPLMRNIALHTINKRKFLEPSLNADRPSITMWLKVIENLGNDPHVHKLMLAYLSDLAPVETSLRPHPVSMNDSNMSFASLDHALWFHQPARTDQWLLHQLDSVIAQGGRGLCRGGFYNEQGKLVASMTQEVLLRQNS